MDGERGDGEGEGSEEPPMITEEFGDLLHPRRVFYTPQRQRLERENVTYFIPSTQPGLCVRNCMCCLSSQLSLPSFIALMTEIAV